MQEPLEPSRGWVRPESRQRISAWRIERMAAIVFLALLSTHATARADVAAPADSTRRDSSVVQVVITPQSPDAYVPVLKMADTVTVLPPVDVRGVRGVTPERSTTTSVRVDRGHANRFLPATVADALVSVPGLDLVKTGPWATQLSLRGLTGDRVMLMVDGVRMNTVRGHGVQSSLVSLDRLDAVELQPGAGSALHGSDALGGVVNIVTHRSLYADQPATSFIMQVRGADPGRSWATSGRARFMGPRAGLELSGSLGGLGYLDTPRGALVNSAYQEDDFGIRGAARFGRASLDLEHTQHAVHDAGLPAFSVATAGAAPSATSGNSGSYPLQRRRAQRLELALQARDWQPDVRVLGVRQTYATRFDEAVTDSIYLRGRVVGSTTNSASDRVATDLLSLEPTLQFHGFGAVRVFGEVRRETASGPVLNDHVTRNLAGDITNATHDEGVSVPPADRTGWAIGAAAAQPVRGFRVETGLRYDDLHSRADSLPNSPTARLDVTDRRTSAEIGLARAFGNV